MPKGRFLNKKVVDDYRLNNVPIEAECLYYKMITHLDREGRLQGDARLINRKFYPLRDFSAEEVEEWLNALWEQKKNGKGLIERYEVEGHQYLWMPGFEGEQGGTWRKEREAPSELPTPPEYIPQMGESTITQKTTVKDDILDEKLKSVVECYEQNIGVLTPALFERLKDISDTYPEGWFQKAVDEAVAYNKRNLKYIERILERWQTEGLSPTKDDGLNGLKVED